MRKNWHHFRRSMAEVLRDPRAVLPVWKEHEGIIERLFSGDINRTAETMERHID